MRLAGKMTWVTALLAGAAAVAVFYFQRSQRLDELSRAARVAVERRDFALASNHLGDYLAARPKDLPIRLLAAGTARRAGDFDAAMKHMQLYLDGGGTKQALLLEERLLRIQQGDFEEARKTLDYCRADRADPDVPAMLEAILEGTLNLLIPSLEVRRTAAPGQAPELLPAVELWLALCPAPVDQSQGYVWRGRLMSYDRRHPEAVADFEQALKLDPDKMSTRLQLAEAIAQERPRDAADHLQLLWQRFPTHYRVRLTLASLRRGLGQFDAAGRLLDQLLSENANDVSALIERGQLALDARQPQLAEQYLRRALVLRTDVPTIHLALSRCLLLLGHEADSKRHRERFLELEAEQKRPAPLPN